MVTPVEKCICFNHFSTVFPFPLWILNRLFHKLWKSVWKKHVLHRFPIDLLCKTPKFSFFRPKTPCFSLFYRLFLVENLSTPLWNHEVFKFFQQTSVDISESFSTDIHPKYFHNDSFGNGKRQKNAENTKKIRLIRLFHNPSTEVP